MKERAHDISVGLLAADGFFWKTYRLRDSGIVRSFQNHSQLEVFPL
jgi:hypothetical protein